MAEERAVTLRTVLGDRLRFRRLTGEEGVSTPFRLTVTLVADDLAVPLEKLLGTDMTVQTRGFAGPRFFHGLVAHAAQAGTEGDFALYEVELRPWLWLLSRTRDCRIFQQLSVVEIVSRVFEKYPQARLDASRLVETYPTRVYCVQYRETDLAFVSRLLESEGIAWFFTHEAGRHTLVLADHPDAYLARPGYAEVPFFPPREGALYARDHLFEWQAAAEIQPGSYVHTAYDFADPRADLLARRAEPMPHELADGEVYDYPGGHLALGEGERLARLRLEEMIARHSRAVARGNAVGLTAGHKFALTQHPRPDQNAEHLVLAIEHDLWDPSYRTGERGAAGLEPYRARYRTMPAARVFRPPLSTPRPVMHGPQTAVVTGAAGAEIHTNEHGQVKVQFHWDRLGKKDENSSCWVRVSQAWAGQGYGGMLIPRIGQEVIVDFLEGDVDQPIITGRVYNAVQTPPYALPGAAAQSGVKSNSTKGGGGSNELMLDDTKGSEKTYFHAQKDAATVVEHDMTEHVRNDRTGTVDADETLLVGGDRTRTVVGNETVTVQSSRTDTVQRNETRTVALVQQQTVGAARNVSVGASQTHEIAIDDSWVVGSDSSWTIGSDRKVKIGANDTLAVGKDRSGKIGDNDSLEVGKDQAVKIGKNQTVAVGENGTVTIGKTLLITAGDEISIKTGKAMIIMKKDGSITIKGKDILIDGSGKIDVKASGNITMKGQKILQN